MTAIEFNVGGGLFNGWWLRLPRVTRGRNDCRATPLSEQQCGLYGFVKYRVSSIWLWRNIYIGRLFSATEALTRSAICDSRDTESKRTVC